MKRVLVATAFALALTMGFGERAAAQTVHEVVMYNKLPDNRKETMVYAPQLIRIQPGDSVKFIATDKGHNAETVKGMVPEGGETFKTKLNKEETVTFTVPGVYGYKCTPHYAAGMVGLIIVEGEGWDANLEEAKAVKHRGKARKRMAALFEEVETFKAASLN